MYKSDKVALAVCGLGVASIVGAMVWAACEEDESAAANPEPSYVSSGNTYAHNTYVPNAGWFHTTTRSFEPYPYNHYDATRGYYYAGDWHAAPAVAGVAAAATPSPEAAERANAAIAKSTGGQGGSGGSSKGSYSRSSGSGSSSSRGGFGSSGGGGS